MLSRVANNLFWMDRYMERSYGLLNLIKTNYNSTLDSGDYSSWDNVLKTYMGIERSTFLIDSNNKVCKIWRKVKVDGHVEDVINTIKTLT